jgi:hypothetical protein
MAACILLMMAGLAGCGDADRESGETALDTAPAAATPPPPPSRPPGGYPAQEGVPAGALGARGSGQKVAVTITEWSVRLSSDSIGGGHTDLQVINQGSRPHVIEVYSQHYGRWRSGRIPPGGSVTMSMPLQFAQYEVYCPDEDEEGSHRQNGMVATLRVQ